MKETTRILVQTFRAQRDVMAYISKPESKAAVEGLRKEMADHLRLQNRADGAAFRQILIDGAEKYRETLEKTRTLALWDKSKAITTALWGFEGARR